MEPKVISTNMATTPVKSKKNNNINVFGNSSTLEKIKETTGAQTGRNNNKLT